MKSSLVLLAFASCAFALVDLVIDYNRTAGLNLTRPEDFPYRNCSALPVTLRRIDYNGLYGTCNTFGNAAPSVIGSGLLVGNATSDEGNFFIPPAVIGFEYKTKNLLSYLDLASIVYYKREPVDPVVNTLIALAFPGVVELDKQNRIVSYVSFNTSGKTGAQTWSALKAVETKDPNLQAYVTEMTAKNDIKFRLTMILSSVAGVVSYGYTPVSPTIVNYVIEVSNWPYKSPLDKLGIVIGTGIKMNEGHFKDNYTTREDEETGAHILSYVATPGYGVADGKIISLLTIEDCSSLIRKTPLVISTDGVNLLNMFLFDNKGLYKFRLVIFPEEAEDIIYGTSVGADDLIYRHIDVPTGDYSSASSLILSIVAVLLALALIF